MSNSEALVVIDMQPGFGSSYPIIKKVAKEIKRAVKLGHHIIVVEYGGFQQTWPYLRSLMKNYDNQTFVEKCTDGGGHDILELIKCANLPDFSKFRLCGVNFGACVKRTAWQLADLFMFSEVEVVYKASNPYNFGSMDNVHQYNDPNNSWNTDGVFRPNLKVTFRR